MEKFGAHKVALVAFALLCSGMATASDADAQRVAGILTKMLNQSAGKPQAPTRPAPAIPQAPDSPSKATIKALLAATQKELATEQEKRIRLEERSRKRRNAANCLEDECPHAKRAYCLEKELIQTKSDYSKGESKKVHDLNRQLIAARAAKAEILSIPGVVKAIEQHHAKSSNTESPLKKFVHNISEAFSSEQNSDSLVKPSPVKRLKDLFKHNDTPPDFQ